MPNRRRLLGLALLALMLLGGSRAHAEPADCHRQDSARFRFHSDPWINLHHFLYQWARNVPEKAADDPRREVEVAEQARLRQLSEEERSPWERAVAYYREQLAKRDLLFSRGMVRLRGELAAIACSEDAGSTLTDQNLQAILRQAMPVYRAHWWPQHHAANSAWIAERLADLERHEAEFSRRLAAAYDAEWPDERIRVDISAYSNWAGGYTTNEPDHVTVSNSYRGLEGVEILFHEVSHSAFFEQRILGQVNAAFRKNGSEPPRRLAHAIQFATPAEIWRALIGSVDYVSISDRVHRRGSFREPYQVVLKHWRPFVSGEADRTTALDAIAAELTAN